MGNLRDANKLRPMKPTDVVLGADEQGCLVNFPPDNFSGSIPISIDTETGDGEELFTEPNLNDFLFKKLKSKDNSADVTTDVDGNIDLSVNFPAFPTIDYPVIESEDVGDGTSMRRGLVGKKIGVRTLKSDSFIITTEGDGSVKINSAGGGSSTNDWYLDANYSRPLNWTPDETIDGIPLPKGTLKDPFLTYDEYLKKVIGATAGVNSRINPRFPYKTLKIMSYTETDKELEVNTATIELVGVDLIYTGTETYAADTGRLFDAMPKTGGVLNNLIYFGIVGEGNIINKYHFGAIRHKTSESATITNKGCFLEIVAKGKGLNILEHKDSATYTLMTEGNGTTPFLHGGSQVHGSTQAPTIPLVKIEGKNTGYWSASFIGTKLNIISKTQSNLELDNSSLVVSADSINYLIDCNYIGYEKKLYTGLSGMTADENELIATTGGLFFKPYEERAIFKSKNSGELRIERIGTISDARIQIAVNSIFHVENGSSIDVVEKYYDTGGGSAVSLIKYVGTGNTVSLSNSVPSSHIHYFVKGDSANSLSVILKLSQINNVDIIKKNTPTLNINTAGTYSSIKAIPINTGLASFVDNAAAIAANYITGMQYFNTTENAVSVVV